MIANITELLNNFRDGFPCVIELNYDSPSASLLYAPIINILDMGGLSEEIQDENTGDTYPVHKIQVFFGTLLNNRTIKAYWTSNISYNSQTGKWIIPEPK